MSFFRQKLLPLCALSTLILGGASLHAEETTFTAPPPSSALLLRDASELTAISAPNERMSFSLNPKIFSERDETERGLIFLDAEETSGSEQLVTAKGGVMLRSRFDAITADLLTLDRVANSVTALGNVTLRRHASEVKGEALTYERDTATGNLTHPEFYLDDIGGRGDAEELTFAGEHKYELKNARLTTCLAPRNDWFLMADEMKFDTDRKIGTAYGASLRFMSVPIFYSPWLEFPLSNDRKSGFLTPTYGTSQARGAEIALPFYWNIAPNYDATITPRVMGRRGIQLNGQFRYLFDTPRLMSGEMELGYLPNDRATDDKINRYLGSWRHRQNITPWLNAYIDVNKVSDDLYFSDLSDQVAVTSQTTLPREIGFNFVKDPFSATLRIQHFQTLQDPDVPLAPPYNRSPQLSAAMSEWGTASMRDWGFSLSGAADVTRFRQPTLARNGAPEGTRAVLHPSLTWRAESLGWFIKAKSSVMSRQYWLDDKRTPTKMEDTTRNVILPVLSLDTGLIFEREGSLFGRSLSQTLEPRLFYVYAPYKNQDKDPLFDTVADDFNFAQLFNENRYVGYDRFGDANQLTAALTSRVYSKEGAEWLRVFAGERFYFSDQRVMIPGEPVRSARSSDVLFGLESQISRTWKATMLTQYNFGSGDAERFNAGLRWSPAAGKILSGSWRYTRKPYQSSTELRQFDIAGQWPLSARWDAVARWNYSLSDKKTLEAIGALEYNADCWILRFAVHRLATTTRDTNTAFFVQLEFGGLGRIGSSPLEVLRRSLPGYTTTDDPSRRDTTPTYSVYPE